MTSKIKRLRSSLLSAALAFLICLIASGCAGLLKQQPLARAYFAIDPGAPESSDQPSPATRSASKILRVRMLRVSPPYDGVAFVYRIGPSQFDTDYYNNFIAPPATLLTGELIHWLTRSGPMTVCDTSSDLRADLGLQGNITMLCIDSATSPPRARVEGRFFFTKEHDGVTELVAERHYEECAPVSARSPAEFARAWGRAYRQLLVRLTDDLRNFEPH